MRNVKRSVSLLLVLLLIAAFVPMTEAATGTLVKNTGTRHELCTALSDQAQAYYTGDYTYENVSALAASATDPTHSAMYSRLHDLMADTMTNSVSYNGSNGLQNYWPYTDANNGSDDPMLFYTDVESSNFNREHVWPKSRASFYQSYGGSDLHHLRPTNTTANSTRSNYTFGNVRNVLSSYSTYSSNGKAVLWYNGSYDNGNGRVEVNDNIKGDVARILLYVWCRWDQPNLFENDPNPVIGPGDDANDGKKVMESLETLLEWMKIDPVDTWEMSRNDQCENIQGNRNVFIDYPQYAWLLFEEDLPASYQTPSGVTPAAPDPGPDPEPEPDYTLFIDGGIVAKHTEIVNGQECLKVEFFVDGVTSDKPMISMQFKLAYDTDQLTYVKQTAKSGINATVNMLTPGSIQFACASTTAFTLASNVPLLTVWFKVADGLQAGETIEFTKIEETRAWYTYKDANGKTVKIERTVATVLPPYLANPLYGDANRDNRVTSADAAAVLRYVVGLETLDEIGLFSAHVCKEADLSAEDAAAIMRFVVGLLDHLPVD